MMHGPRPAAEVSREARTALELYAELVIRWNDRVNLVSAGSVADFKTRHVDDSLQLAALIPSHIRRALDMGSGAGLPGLVLSIATHVPFVLVEADKRKAAFLREAVRVTGASASVQAQRVEAVDETVDLVTARALAPVGRLLAWAHRLLQPDGLCLFLKPEGVEDELEAAATVWQMEVRLHSSVTRVGSRILEVRGLKPR